MNNNIKRLTLSADDALALIGILRTEIDKIKHLLDKDKDGKTQDREKQFEQMLKLSVIYDKLLKFI